MTTDAEWAEMTERQKDAVVDEVVFGYSGRKWRGHLHSIQRRRPDYTSTWPGFGLVVVAMREKGWEWDGGSRHPYSKMAYARFFRPDDADWADGAFATGNDVKAATALAAVRAMEAEK